MKAQSTFHWLTYLFILVVLVWASSNVNWSSGRCTRIIKSDGNGYYAYLPAIFIYKDLHFGFFEEIASRPGHQNMKYDYRYNYKGNIVNKHFAGTSLAQLPFFAGAHFLSKYYSKPVDGYSSWYLIAINIASVFYLLLACIFLDKLLNTYKISVINRALILLCTVFGTNVYYYTVYEPSMSHIYSFGFMSMFVWFIRRYFLKPSRGMLLLSAFMLGIIVLIRPVNGIILGAVPFLADDFAHFKNGFRRKAVPPATWIAAVLIFFSIIAIQPIIYKLQTGEFFVYSYGQEKFIFRNPHIAEILFSYRKGLFLYTPIWFISLAGLFFIAKESFYKLIWWLIFFLLLTYVLSSWEQWWYGGSFSSRVYIEYFMFFAILLGYLLENIKNPITRGVFIAILGLLVVVCVIQTYQYYFAHIHWEDMDKEKYWDVFLRVDRLLK